MKKKFGVLLVLILIVLGCRKDEINIPANMLVTAFFNGEEWEAISESNMTENRRIGFTFEVRKGGVLRESLGFGKLPLEIGLIDSFFMNQDTNFSSGYVTISHDGDVLKDRYLLDKEVSTNFFSIVSLDTIAKEIGGEFDLTFVIDSVRGKVESSAPDAIRFSEGKYKVKYE